MESFGDPEAAVRSGLDRFYVLTARSGADLDALAQWVQDVSVIVASALPERFAAPDAVNPLFLRLHGRDENLPEDNPGHLPVNDQYFPVQWSLRNTGQDVCGQVGIPGADIAAPGAWPFVPPGSAVVVAVLDTGVSPTHPDLAGQLVPGQNFADGNADDTDDKALSHGTSTAGVLAARTNNEIGIAGVAPYAKIMPVRIFNSFGFGFETEFVAGVMYAADHGADVISMSLGYPFDSDAMKAAVRYAYERDIVLVASTGNTPGQAVQFPASMPETIAVGATNNLDVLWNNSTTGPQISLVAPGVDVWATWDTPSEPGSYREQSGTSFAVPHVSGTAAMMRAANPTLSNEEVAWALINSCIDLGDPGWDESYGYGRLNAKDAVALAIALGPVQCLADVDGDGRFTVEDIDAYVIAFLAGDPKADLAAPFGSIDTNDLEAFVAAALSPDCG
ncbi:MAG: hypothetical protein DHS20C14_16630 [Phycisphaeraceae bacterium]|nr:MAG: hypothetical protein DHS20C14_16630 [Phycisphaeraceae bacterium]